MADKKNPPLWKQLGYKRVKNEKGSFLGYETPEGKYIPRRQYDILQGKPGKGSPGYKERTDIIPRKRVPIEDYAKGKGNTLEGYETGKEYRPLPEVFNDTERHFKAVLKQRMGAIQLKYEAGLITRQEWSRLRDLTWKEDELRRKLADIWEELENDIPDSRREELERKYLKLHRDYVNTHKKLVKAGVVPERETDLEHGYYH